MKKFRLFIGIIPFLILSCVGGSDYVYYDDAPNIEVKNQRKGVSKDDRMVDVLFVIDNSGSMSDIQNNIISNAKLFMDNFLQNNIMEWRIGIISTDYTENPYLGFTSIFDMFTSNPIPIFREAVADLGIYGSASEHTFYNVQRMITDSQYNHFFREGAHLAVIMVTDEKEQSQDDFGAQYEPLTFLNTLKSFKASNRVVRFYGAFGLSDMTSCDGRSDKYAGSAFETIINESGGIAMSACTSQFGVDLAKIGEDIVRLGEAPRFTLDTRPKIETIVIKFNGVVLPMGKESEGGLWYYDKYFNTINFYSLDWAGEIGDEVYVDITYDIDDGIVRDPDET